MNTLDGFSQLEMEFAADFAWAAIEADTVLVELGVREIVLENAIAAAETPEERLAARAEMDAVLRQRKIFLGVALLMDRELAQMLEGDPTK